MAASSRISFLDIRSENPKAALSGLFGILHDANGQLSLRWILRHREHGRDRWLFDFRGLCLDCYGIRISFRNHDMEASLTAFLFRLDKVLFLEVCKIVYNPLVLLAREPTLPNIDRCASKMRGCNFALCRSGITVYARQMALLLRRAYCGVDFQRLMKLIVKIAAQVVDKLRRPWTRIATVLFQRGTNGQILRFRQRNENTTLLELFELLVSFNSRQAGFVDLFVLLKKRVARSAQLRSHRRAKVAQTPQMCAMTMGEMSCRRPARHIVHARVARGRNQNRQECEVNATHLSQGPLFAPKISYSISGLYSRMQPGINRVPSFVTTI